MVDEVKDSQVEPAPTPALVVEPAVVAEPAPVTDVAEPVVVAPEVPVAVSAEPVTPVPDVKRKPGRKRKDAAKAVTAKAPAKPETPVAEVPAPVAKAPAAPKSATKPRSTDAKPVKVAKPVKKAPVLVKAKPIVSAKPRVKPVAAAFKTPAPRKELFVMATTTTEFTEKLQSAVKDVTEKAKTAFEKSQAAFGDAGTFAKGNVEAIVESSKILASGLQEMSKGYVAESKTSLETLTSEIKDLASAKSPTEFFEKQSALLRKQFDAAVAASSKNSEAMLKLASEAFQPISTRVSLAVEKVKQAA